MQTESPVLVLCYESGEHYVSLKGRRIEESIDLKDLRVSFQFNKVFACAGHTDLNTVPVKALEEKELLPKNFLACIPEGPSEMFAAKANLR